MNPMLMVLLFVASAYSNPLPGFLEDQLGLSSQKSWIADFAKTFQGTSQLAPATEEAPVPVQGFDFKLGYDFLQGLLAKMFTPKPLVDTIEEQDKYGNDGSRHQLIGNAVVKGTEALSKMLNAAFDVPKLAAKMVSNSITQALNGLGAKLIGL